MPARIYSTIVLGFVIMVSCTSAGAQNALPSLGQTISLPDLLELRAHGDTASLEEQVSQLKRLGEEGDGQALVTLGSFYASPDVSEPQRAIKYLQESGVPGAITKIGDIYREGRITEQDLSAAFKFYNEAAELGSPSGIARRGEAYLLGAGVAQETEEGLAILEQASGSGNALAAQILGDAYAKGHGVDVNPKKALSYYEASAKQGNSAALVRVGDLFQDGKLFPADPVRAFEAYSEAAESGNVWGRLRSAEAYVRGFGVAADVRKGLSLLDDIGSDGEVAALKQVGDYLRAGDYAEADPDRAIESYQAAAAAGFARAYLSLAEMFLDGTAGEKDPKEAIHYFKLAEEHGVAEARVRLLNAHLNKQLGTLSDPKKAFEDVTELASQGAPEARVVYANALYYGRGTARDSRGAIQFLEKASTDGSAIAARRLAYFYREAPYGYIRRDPARAIRVLESARNQIEPTTFMREIIATKAVMARTTEEYEELTVQLRGLPPTLQVPTLASIRSNNENLYIYVAQRRLKDAGYYNGKAHGLLTRETIRSINVMCAQEMRDRDCKKGPLDPSVARKIAVFLTRLNET